MRLQNPNRVRRQTAVANVNGVFRFVALLCLTGTCSGVDEEQVCPIRIGGTNYIVSYQNYSVSPHLPDLPDGTIVSNYGPAVMCGYEGTIVVGGPLSLSPESKWYGYSVMIRQSLSIFLDWLNGVRGGVEINGLKYAMRFVWVDDDSSGAQVGPATAHATRKTNADFSFGGYSSGLTTHAARQSYADGYLVRAATQYRHGPTRSPTRRPLALWTDTVNARAWQMMSGGAASTSVFTQNDLTFGLFPPASTCDESHS